MANWSVGTADQFYGLPLSPVVRFDGSNDYGTGLANPNTSADYYFEVSYTCAGVNGNEQILISNKGGDNTRTCHINLVDDATGGDVRLYTTTGFRGLYDVFGTINVGEKTTLRAEVYLSEKKVRTYKNGIYILDRTYTGDILPATSLVDLGYNLGGWFFKGDIHSVDINGTSYIQQGDQSAGTLVPSHPSGADGTLYNGATWQYGDIEANYLTPALAVSAITTTNPTEPVTIYILDSSTDVSGIPATINGQPVTVSFAYCGACDASFGFGFGFNF